MGHIDADLTLTWRLWCENEWKWHFPLCWVHNS